MLNPFFFFFFFKLVLFKSCVLLVIMGLRSLEGRELNNFINGTTYYRKKLSC